jgi:hypothetical protein
MGTLVFRAGWLGASGCGEDGWPWMFWVVDVDKSERVAREGRQ